MNNPKSDPHTYLTETTVVRLDNPDLVIGLDMPRQMFIVEQFVRAIANLITKNLRNYPQKWCEDGVPCSILVPGQDWQRGSIRIRIEFTPESSAQPEPEPPTTLDEPSLLDDIRRTLINP